MVDAGSVRIHLQSLKDFAQQLQDQLDLVAQPTRALAELKDGPDLPLGAFAEAFALGDDHSDVLRDMGELLLKVRQSIDFAGDVTRLIAKRYESLNAAAVQGLNAVGTSLSAGAPPVGAAPAVLPAYGGGAVAPAYTGTVPPPPGSLLPPDLARFVVPLPPDGGTVYYYNGDTAAPVSVTIQSGDG
jgi:hypothetical protein